MFLGPVGIPEWHKASLITCLLYLEQAQCDIIAKMQLIVHRRVSMGFLLFLFCFYSLETCILHQPSLFSICIYFMFNKYSHIVKLNTAFWILIFSSLGISSDGLDLSDGLLSAHVYLSLV